MKQQVEQVNESIVKLRDAFVENGLSPKLALYICSCRNNEICLDSIGYDCRFKVPPILTKQKVRYKWYTFVSEEGTEARGNWRISKLAINNMDKIAALIERLL